jgi:sulfonate dioxygenase
MSPIHGYHRNYHPDKHNSYTPLTPFKHHEHGRDADPSFPNLLPKDKAEVDNLTPNFGSEVSGIQLSKLTDAGKDELALFVAQRGVVAFRSQDFADLPIQEALDFGGYFGRHHIHPASGQPEGHPEIHLVHRGAEDSSITKFLETRTSSVTWHSDVTYEKQVCTVLLISILENKATNLELAARNYLPLRSRYPQGRKRQIQRRRHGLRQPGGSLRPSFRAL